MPFLSASILIVPLDPLTKHLAITITLNSIIMQENAFSYLVYQQHRVK